MNRIACGFVILLLVGCQGHTGKTHAEKAKPVVTQEFLHPKTLQEYALNVRYAVQHQLFYADSYAGKTCIIKVEQLPGEQPSSMNAEGGDPSLCTAALQAVRSAIDNNTFPFKPNGVPDIVFDFRL